MAFLVAALLAAGAAAIATAARQREPGSSKTASKAATDSVLRIPRVSRPPDLDKLVEQLGATAPRKAKKHDSKDSIGTAKGDAEKSGEGDDDGTEKHRDDAGKGEVAGSRTETAGPAQRDASDSLADRLRMLEQRLKSMEGGRPDRARATLAPSARRAPPARQGRAASAARVRTARLPDHAPAPPAKTSAAAPSQATPAVAVADSSDDTTSVALAAPAAMADLVAAGIEPPSDSSSARLDSTAWMTWVEDSTELAVSPPHGKHKHKHHDPAGLPPGGPIQVPDGALISWLAAGCAVLPVLWVGAGWLFGRRRRAASGSRNEGDDSTREVSGMANGTDERWPGRSREPRHESRRNGTHEDRERRGADRADTARARNGRHAAESRAAAAAPEGTKPPTRLRSMVIANLMRVKGSVLLAVFFMVGGAAIELLKPWPLKVILDHAILARPLPEAMSFLSPYALTPTQLLIGSSLAIVAISMVGGMFSYLEVFITKAIGYRMVYALRREVFSHLQRLSLSYHNRARSGDLLTTFGKDTSTLKDVFAEALLKFADHFLSVLGMLVILWFVNWKMCLIALCSLPFLGFTLMHLYRQTKMSLKKQRKQEGRVTSRMNEVLAAVPLVQAFGRERHEEERYDAVSDVTLKESIRMARLEAAASRSSHIMTAAGTSAVVLFGGLEVMQGRMLPGELVLVMSYLTHMYKPLRSLAKLSIEFSKASASAERIAEVLDEVPEIQDSPDAIEAPPLKGEIIFAAVSFDYGDGREVLRHISFEISPGQRLALVGVSGAGKSTIASLILRLYEAQQGAILIDGIGIERFRRESLRRQIGTVLQQSVLFGATIRENIAYGKPEASDEEIESAARTANAHEFIEDLEDGYDAVIGERGVTLSAGQRQRIAIARAIIRNPRILILDEPMTGLDVENEARVREALDRLMAGKTTLMITHDLHSIADSDRVLVLQDGRIAERGTHRELLRESGRYRQLFELGDHAAFGQAAGT